MGRISFPAIFNVGRRRLGAGILVLLAATASRSWAADTAPGNATAADAGHATSAAAGNVASAAPASVAVAEPEPAALPPDSPEMQTRATLHDYLMRVEPQRLLAMSTEPFTRAQVEARIEALDQAGRAAELSDACLYYLTSLAPDPKNYLNVLYKLAVVLNLRGDDATLLTLVFDSADRFPPGAAPVQQIRLVQAEYFLHLGLTEPALRVLQKLCDQSDVTPAVRMIAAGRVGFLHEHLGQPDDALRYYLLAGQDLTAGASANEALVRACFLQLELGRTADALDTIAKLRQVPPDVLAKSPAAPVITDLVGLAADPDGARAYWSHQEKWYAQWRALATDLGVKPDDPSQPATAAYIESYQQLALEGSVALNQKDAAEYFGVVDQFFRSGRWRPGDLADAASLLYQGLSLAPDKADRIFALGALLEQDMPPSNVKLFQQLTQLRVAVMVDNNQVAAARDLAAAALDKYGSGDIGGQALARLYGYAVVRAGSVDHDGPEAARILADSLTDPAAHGSQRTLAVAVLSDLYLAMGRDKDAQALLEKELAAPISSTDTTTLRNEAALRDELARLKDHQAQAENFDTALHAWWDPRALPWFQYVTASEQAGALSTVDDPSIQAARSFARALDASATVDARVAAWQDAWNAYLDLPLRGADLVDSVEAFIGGKLPAEMRAYAWSKAEWHLLWSGERAAAAKLLASAPDGVSDDDKADFALWLDYLDQPATVAAQQAMADKVLALPKVTPYGVMLVVRVTEMLARLGEHDAAQAVFAKLGEAKLDGLGAQQYKQVGTMMQAIIQTDQALLPAGEALRDLVLQARPQEAAAAQLPQSWLDLNGIWQPNLALLPQADVREGLLAVIRDRLPYGRHPLQVYLDYAEALSFSPEDNALRLSIFETAQRLASTDDERYYSAMFVEIVDFDNPELAQRAWTDLAPARAAAYPKTAGFLQYFDTMMKWRVGDTVDPLVSLGPFNAPDVDAYRLQLALDYDVQHEDRAALADLLAARPEKDFLQMPVLVSYIRALRLLGKEAALTRASDAARQEIAKDVAESWAQPDITTVDPVFALARALDDPQAYPRAWAEYLLANIRNENTLDLVRVADARLQRDWTGSLAAAESYLSRNPTNYDAYWYKAEALLALGRESDALEPLRVYLKYSHNDDQYPTAQAWLQKLESTAGQPPATAVSSKLPR